MKKGSENERIKEKENNEKKSHILCEGKYEGVLIENITKCLDSFQILFYEGIREM